MKIKNAVERAVKNLELLCTMYVRPGGTWPREVHDDAKGGPSHRISVALYIALLMSKAWRGRGWTGVDCRGGGSRIGLVQEKEEFGEENE